MCFVRRIKIFLLFGQVSNDCDGLIYIFFLQKIIHVPKQREILDIIHSLFCSVDLLANASARKNRRTRAVGVHARSIRPALGKQEQTEDI